MFKRMEPGILKNKIANTIRAKYWNEKLKFSPLYENVKKEGIKL